MNADELAEETPEREITEEEKTLDDALAWIVWLCRWPMLFVVSRYWIYFSKH
jgi:hypothetical protein